MQGSGLNFPRLARVACALVLSVPGMASAMAATPAPNSLAARNIESLDGLPQRLVLALDGIPYDVFVGLQQKGHFAGFRPAARMVSTFPSLSDVAFAAIEGSTPPAGYQTTHFDPKQNKMVGHTIGALSERAHPKIASDAGSHSVPHRIMGYVLPSRIALGELKEIGNALLDSRKATFVAYLGTSDAVLHLQGRAGAEKFLVEAEQYLQSLQEQIRARTGRGLMIDIVSDHGSTMVPSAVVPVEDILRACGFRRRNGMTGDYDTTYALPGLVGSMAITTSVTRREDAGRCLAVAAGIDLIAVNRGESVGVLSVDGEAEVRLLSASPERYGYRALRGDPLGLLPAGAVAGVEVEFDQSRLFALTRDGDRPDPLRRLWRSFHGDVLNPCSLLVSLRDGYEVGNPLLRMMTRLRGGHAGTHGSMTRLASLGVFASNWRDVDDVNAGMANEALFGTAITAQMTRSAPPARTR